MNKFFKITYLLSGKYKSTYKAKIMSWEKEIVNIRDENGREYNLKEEYILSIKAFTTAKTSIDDSSNTDLEQNSLFN